MFLYQKKVHPYCRLHGHDFLNERKQAPNTNLGMLRFATHTHHPGDSYAVKSRFQTRHASQFPKVEIPPRAFRSMISGLSSEEYRQSEPQFLKSTWFLAARDALGVSGESSCILSPSIAALQVSPWSIPRCHHHPLLLKSGLSSSNLSRRWQKVRPFKRLF